MTNNLDFYFFSKKKLSLNQVATLQDFENRNVSNFGFNPFFRELNDSEQFWAKNFFEKNRRKMTKSGTQVATLRGPKIKCLIFRFYCVIFAN